MSVSVEQTNVIDVISTDRKSGHVVLTITDHLDWTDGIGHQKMLQEKLNRYLAFVEGGELVDRYPDLKGRPIAFKVVFKFSPDAAAQAFLAKAKQIIESAGFTLRHEVFAASYEN
jgi:hypothetical protein